MNTEDKGSDTGTKVTVDFEDLVNLLSLTNICCCLSEEIYEAIPSMRTKTFGSATRSLWVRTKDLHGSMSDIVNQIKRYQETCPRCGSKDLLVDCCGYGKTECRGCGWVSKKHHIVQEGDSW